MVYKLLICVALLIDQPKFYAHSMTEETMLAFASAWSRLDLEAVMDFFTEDCVYQASVGIEPGCTYTGKTAVRQGIEQMMHHDLGSESRVHNLCIVGERGFWEWTYRFANGDLVKGCDLFEFHGNQIRVKNAFRKTRG